MFCCRRAMDKANKKRKDAADRARQRIRDKRRFTYTPPPDGEPRVVADWQTSTTLFPSRVNSADGAAVLADGADHVKLGGDVLIGRLMGAKILTLALVERETCPLYCTHWQDCYTNNMPFLNRWTADEKLETVLRIDVSRWCNKQEAVLIRLHMSGDFYSVDYVGLWRELLLRHANLYVFGFTAWVRGTDIGDAVARLRDEFPTRFMMRVSGRTGEWGSFTVDFPTKRLRIGDAIVCPEQVDAMNSGDKRKHCGNCAVCWQTSLPIVFVEH